MVKNLFRLSSGIIRKQRTYYSLLALFFTLVLAFSPVIQLPAAAQATTPVLSLSASCTLDAQGTFVITNTGSNMTGPGTWTLLLNGTPIASNSFQLNGGTSLAINTSGLFGTLEFDPPAEERLRPPCPPSASRRQPHSHGRPRPCRPFAFSQLHSGRPGDIRDHQYRFEYDRARHVDLLVERHSHCQQ